jgi:hypothetical protein
VGKNTGERKKEERVFVEEQNDVVLWVFSLKKLSLTRIF